MKFVARVINPTNNRRLNELLGFLLCVFALLLFLALASYSPLDPSLNSASVLTGSRVARNWIGIVGAYGSDLLLQFFGVGGFLLSVFALGMGLRWFRSRKVVSPVAKLLGGIWLLMFVPALLALSPGHLRWVGAVPLEGLLGRILGDMLVHYFNLAGAYIVATSMLAVALYFCTAFSFSQAKVWAATRFSFAVALRDRWRDWRDVRLRRKLRRELEKRRAARPMVQTQVFARSAAPAQVEQPRPEPRKTGIERFAEEEAEATASSADKGTRATPPDVSQPDDAPSEAAIGLRADSAAKAKTTMPRVAGGYKLPPSSLLHRADEQQTVNADELKILAQVLTEKYAEFDVHGQVTQINPGPVVTTFEFKPEAGIKYSRITSLTDDLCLALRAESILIERMAGKSTVGIQVPNR
jgi:S-DNA-T family DNA segregation ATPase FtsK/SpoIIIE